MRVTCSIVFCLMSGMAACSPYFDNITNLWYTARHTNVLALANARLASNTNDIAGLLMKASWDYVYSNPPALSNSLDRVVAVGRTVRSPAFTKQFAVTVADVEWMKEYLNEETTDDRRETLQKGSKPGRLPHYLDELKALDDDGYFSE